MNYLERLEKEYAYDVEANNQESKLDYLSSDIFGFTTYDEEIGAFLARKALEICAAISNGTTFDYIKDAENYKWYIVILNTKFFSDKLDWGTSIRGAWWNLYNDETFKITSGYLAGEHGLIEFNKDQWPEFVKAMIEFAGLKDEIH